VLFAAGATVDHPSGPTQGTPLHQAARWGSVSVAAALLDHGANLDARDQRWWRLQTEDGPLATRRG
jgi:ankyrin repeat protein